MFVSKGKSIIGWLVSEVAQSFDTSFFCTYTYYFGCMCVFTLTVSLTVQFTASCMDGALKTIMNGSAERRALHPLNCHHGGSGGTVIHHVFSPKKKKRHRCIYGTNDSATLISHKRGAIAHDEEKLGSFCWEFIMEEEPDVGGNFGRSNQEGKAGCRRSRQQHS